jgi:hypothetical protein
MMRFFATIVGLGATGFGIWLIASEQPKNAACNVANSSVSQLPGVGSNSSCLNIAWAYFGGFAMLAVGVLTVVVALTMMKRVRKNRGGYQERPPGPHVGKPS